MEAPQKLSPIDKTHTKPTIEHPTSLSTERSPNPVMPTSKDAHTPLTAEQILPKPSPSYSATFTREIASSLERSGIDTEYVDPVPLGEGANHLTYRYSKPGEVSKVIKLAKSPSLTTLTHGKEDEEKSFKIGKEHFGDFALSTEFKSDPQIPNFYFMIQDEVKGNAVTNAYIKEHPQARKQLMEIGKLNMALYKERGMSLDFVGMPGFQSWIKRQWRKLLMRKSEFEVSNILVDPQGKLKIIDFEFFTFGMKTSLFSQVKNAVASFVNKRLMQHYFGVKI